MNETHDQKAPFCNYPLPKVTFSTFIVSLASAALVSMGEVPDPATGEIGADMLVARHNIDVLEMLRQKTRGALETHEKDLLENIICELRLKYVLNCDKQK